MMNVVGGLVVSEPITASIRLTS